MGPSCCFSQHGSRKSQGLGMRLLGSWFVMFWPHIDVLNKCVYIYIYIYGYGSIPINTIFSGMNIHLPAILMFTRGTRFWHTAIYIYIYIDKLLQQRYLYNFKLYVFCKTLIYIYIYNTQETTIILIKVDYSGLPRVGPWKCQVYTNLLKYWIAYADIDGFRL